MVVTWAYNAGTNTATASGAGSTNFAALVAADTAGGWGKFTADATGTQIICNGKIVIGDGTNVCAFADTNKQINCIKTDIGHDGIFIYVRKYSSCTLGTLVSSSNKSTKSGCSFYFPAQNTAWWTTYLFQAEQHSTVLADSGQMYFYSCVFNSLQGITSGSCYLRFVNTVYNCLSSYVGLSVKADDVYNFYVEGNQDTYGFNSVFQVVTLGFTCNKASIMDSYIAIQMISTTSDVTIRNLYARNNTHLVNQYNTCTANLYLINPDVDVRHFGLRSDSGEVYFQYEFDLQVCDNAESEAQGTVVPIEGADVTLFDKDGNEVFNETSAADGWIPTQTVSRGYYAQATGDTLQDYGPHFLVVTKAGYEDYMDEYILTEKRTNQISMNVPSIPADLATAEPSDVLSGETFFGKAGTQQTGTLTQTVTPLPTMPVKTRTVTKYIEDPVTEPALMALAVEIIQKRKYKKQLERMQLYGTSH